MESERKAGRIAGLSAAERLAAMDAGTRDGWLDLLDRHGLAELSERWPFWARPSQLAPAGAWSTWLILAGRGFGKTRAGAEWVRARAEADGRLRIALVGATEADARHVMVEGESGLIEISTGRWRPKWEPSLGRLTWPNGAMAFTYSADAPERLRGPQHHLGWADEIGKWAQGEAAWDNLALGMRLGRWPRTVATTTPRPVALVRRLAADPGTRVTRGGTDENRAHLPGSFVEAIRARYGGTRLGRQELDGELIEEIEGALWTRALLERARTPSLPPTVRLVIGVDPPASAHGDACGIVAVALGRDGRGYVIEDRSVEKAGPAVWAAAVADVATRLGADRVVAEANNGGDMVASVLTAARSGLPVKLVHASRGKAARAEPVAAMYEGGRVSHVGVFPEMEDELCGLMLGGGYEGPGRSPDRADALVWALTELMLGRGGEPSVRML